MMFEVGQAARIGNAVQDDQRVIAGRQRVLAADQQRLVAARSLVAGGDVQTGDLSDQTVHQVVGRNHLQRLFADHGKTSREVLLLLRTVTHDDHFVEGLRILRHLHVHDVGRADPDLPAGITQARENQRRGRGGLDLINTLRIGDGGIVVPAVLYEYDDTRQGRSVFIGDLSGHVNRILCKQRSGRQQQQNGHRQSAFKHFVHSYHKRFRLG